MNRKQRLHNKIGRSVATLPLCALLAVALWWLPQGHYSLDYAVGLVLTLLTAYVIAETNNSNMLIRTRSRMISSVWIFGAACIGLLHPFSPALLASFCLAVSYYLLFRSYQKPEPVVDAFHSLFMLSLGSIVVPKMIYLAPVFVWHLGVFMQAITLRTFFAALVGALLPFWFWAGWQMWEGDLAPMVAWLRDVQSVPWVWLRPFDETLAPTLPHIVFLALAVFSLWSAVSYLFHSFDDKIRTRMMLYVYVFQTLLLVLFGCLTATDDMLFCLLPLLLLSASPLLAHYFTLSNTWFSLIFFLLFVLTAAFIGILTLAPTLLPEALSVTLLV